MLQIIIKANTENAFKGLQKHIEETSNKRNERKLKKNRVRQELINDEMILILSYDDLFNKLESISKEKFTGKDKFSTAVMNSFNGISLNDYKKNLIKSIDKFMNKQKVDTTEYEVNFYVRN